jgi:hypothetical protein
MPAIPAQPTGKPISSLAISKALSKGAMMRARKLRPKAIPMSLPIGFTPAQTLCMFAAPQDSLHKQEAND